MPGLNRMGPNGLGPRTGWGLGRCGSAGSGVDDANGYPVDFIGERGRRMRSGRRGGGWGRGRGRGGVFAPAGPVGPAARDLSAEAEVLRARLAEIERQMEGGQED